MSDHPTATRTGDGATADAGLSPGRGLVAVVAVVCLWLAAGLATLMSLGARANAPEAADPGANLSAARLALLAGMAAVLLSGPVAWLVTRRRWALVASLPPIVLGWVLMPLFDRMG